jgi:peptidoglycan hydrolase-like amidase
MYAPCNTRIPYLTAVKKSLDQQISQNNLKKSNNENDLSKLEDDLINLDSQRQ